MNRTNIIQSFNTKRLIKKYGTAQNPIRLFLTPKRSDDILTEPKIDIVIIYAQIKPDCQVFLNQFSHRELHNEFNALHVFKSVEI